MFRKNADDDINKMEYFIGFLVFDKNFREIFSNAPDVANINQLR